MQTARTALSVAARVYPRTGLLPWTKPAGGMVQVHTSPSRPNEPQQNCLQPILPYRTSRTDWSRLDMGCFIGAGVLFAAGLYEYHRTVQTTSTQHVEPVPSVKGVCYIRTDLSLETGLNKALLPSQTPDGVLQRNTGIPSGLIEANEKVAGNKAKNEQEDQRGSNLSSGPAVGRGEATKAEKSCDCPHEVSDETDKKVPGNEATIEQEDQRVPTQSSGPADGKACSCPHEVSDETPTAAGPVKMGDKALVTGDDVGDISTKSSKMSDGTVSAGDGGDTGKVFEDTVVEESESPSVDFESPQQSLPDNEGRADDTDVNESSESDVTGCADDQGLVAELPTSSPKIDDQTSPSAPPPRDKGHVPGGTAEKDHGFCEDEGTSDVSSNTSDVNSNTSDDDKSNEADRTPDVDNNISDVNSTAFDRPDLPEPDVEYLADGEDTEDDAISSSEEKCPRHADFTAAEVMTVTACPVQHELSTAGTGSEIHDTGKADTKISGQQFLSMDLFDRFFGGGFASRSQGRERRGKNVVLQLSVSLEELYIGATRKLALQTTVICEKCEGRGGKKGAEVESCPNCRGTGMQLGPGMVQQIPSMCHECQGQGERISARDRCKTCKGRKIVRERKILDVHIDKGMKDGQKITFHGEGDQEPGLEPGDIIIVLDEKEHPVFHRNHGDLLMKMEIELVEALCGFQRPIKTLDSRTLLITSHPGELIKYGDVKCIVNEGMPMYRNPFDKGRLIIQFVVNLPPDGFLPKERLPELEALLPEREEVLETDDAEVVDLVRTDPSQQRNRFAGNAYDEDDEHPHRGGVQCATQ